MVRQHHQLNGHEFEQTPGDNEGEGSLVCCSPGGRRVGCDLVTEQQHVRHHHYKQDFCGKCRISSKLGFGQDCRLLLILTHCSMSRSISSLCGQSPHQVHPASLMSQLVKNLPAMQQAQIRSLGQEDPLEQEVATHSSIFAWSIPWTEEPGRWQAMGSQSDTTEHACMHIYIYNMQL